MFNIGPEKAVWSFKMIFIYPVANLIGLIQSVSIQRKGRTDQSSQQRRDKRWWFIVWQQGENSLNYFFNIISFDQAETLTLPKGQNSNNIINKKNVKMGIEQRVALYRKLNAFASDSVKKED